MNSQTPPWKWGGGGGDSLVECHSGDEIHAANPTKPNAHLYTIRTIYRIFGLPIFRRTYTKIHKINNHPIKNKFCLKAVAKNDDFCNIGKYISTTPNINEEIFALIRGLSEENQNFVLRQISRSKEAYDKNCVITDLTAEEIKELKFLYEEFYPNILTLSENLHYYGGYFLPIKDFIADVFVYKHYLAEVFSKKTLDDIRNKDIIDVGGFICDSAVILEREFTDKNVYSFEPTRSNHELALQTLRLNDSKRVIAINKGLGAQKSTMQIDLCGGASSLAFSRTQYVENVEITTLDDFVKEHNLQVGLIKVDIEGFEMEFLKGAKDTICSQKPALSICIYHSGRDYFHIKPLIESWNLGYRFEIFKRMDGYFTIDTALFCEILE